MKRSLRVSPVRGVGMAGVLALGLASCGPGEPTTADIEVPPSPSIGELHNAALAQALSSLRAAKGQQLSRDDMIGIVHRSINSWAEQEGLRQLSSTDIQSIYEASRDYLESFANRDVQHAPGQLMVSAAVQPYFNRILEAAERGTDPGWLTQPLAEIEADARTGLTGTDLRRVLDAVSVAEQTSRYWDTHLEEWQSVVYDAMTAETGAARAMSGAFAGCGLRRWGRMGWAILGADAVGAFFGFEGAAAASGVTAVIELFTFIYDCLF